MIVVDPGHLYNLKDNKQNTYTPLKFYKDPVINEEGYNGTTNQEVLRALIDRIKYLDNQLPHPNNKEIIKCLRKAIILHEQRHLDRLLDKNAEIENLETFDDSHIVRIKS